jgi:hypothetical protein
MSGLEIVLEVFSLVHEYGLLVLFVLIIVWLVSVVIDEDRSALWRGRLYKLLHGLSGRREDEKKFISNDINARINLARRGLHFGKEVLPKSVRVEWVSGEGLGAYDIKEGEFVVRLDPAESQEANIVRLATVVVQRTSCTGVRHVMQRPLIEAVDLTLVRSILREVGSRRALEWFFAKEYDPCIRDPKVSAWADQIVEIDEKGLFARILLVELERFAKRIHGVPPRSYMAGEIEGLVSFLYKIATKQVGQDVPLQYCMAYIRVGVLLVAETSKLLSRGIIPYVRCVHRHVQREMDAVYVIVFDKDLLGEVDPQAREEFMRLTASLDDAILQSSVITKDFEVKYSCVDSLGRKRRAKCTRYAIASSTLVERRAA